MKYTVRLTIPTCVWANHDVDAATPEEAIKLAMAANKAGEIAYEYGEYENDDVEVDGVTDENDNDAWTPTV